MATTDRASGADPGTSPPALAWVVPVLAFLAGCLLSGIAVALVLSGGDEQEPDVAAARPTASPTAPLPTASPSPGSDVRVPQSCLDAATSALQSGEDAEDLAEAVRDLDARRLAELVDRLQENQPALQQAAQRCRSSSDERIEDGVLEDGVLETPAPSATGTPTGTPTG